MTTTMTKPGSSITVSKLRYPLNDERPDATSFARNIRENNHASPKAALAALRKIKFVQICMVALFIQDQKYLFYSGFAHSYPFVLEPKMFKFFSS